MTHVTTSGALILDARLRTGLTQRELARRAGTSPSAIAYYELGQRAPSMDTLIRIIDACGMQLLMKAVPLTESDVAQYNTDSEVGEEQAWVNAELFRQPVRWVRPAAAAASLSCRRFAAALLSLQEFPLALVDSNVEPPA